MAWVDDRIWCHPKYADVSKQARWGAVAAIAYSSGFATNGYLTNGQVTQLGVTRKERLELVTVELWHEVDGGIEIHDWDEHNGKRDARKAADADRKRAAYWKEKGTEPPQETPRRNSRRQGGENGSTARVDWNEGSDGNTRAVALEVDAQPPDIAQVIELSLKGVA